MPAAARELPGLKVPALFYSGCQSGLLGPVMRPAIESLAAASLLQVFMPEDPQIAALQQACRAANPHSWHIRQLQSF